MLCLRQTPRTAIHLRANCILLTRLRVTSPPQCLFVPHSSLPSSATSLVITIPTRPSSSSTRWKSRQTNDHFAKSARVAGLKSRAAYKLLELDAKHRLFRKGGTVVDLGYAPGSWSQVAVNRTAPGGRVVGIDVIPAQPPRGASSIQGNFLSAEVQEEVRSYVRDYWKGRARRRGVLARRVAEGEEDEEQGQEHDNEDEEEEGVSEDEVEGLSRGIVELGRESSASALASASTAQSGTNLAAHGDIAGEEANAEPEKPLNQAEKDDRDGRVVDVVLSDMSAPWEQITGTWIKSVNNPYHRMMNTSGMPFRDHAGSMDLCNAALTFCYSTLRTGGHFLCKFYQGSEEKAFELRLKKLFEKVHREKPESSRAESKEAYFVALRRKPDVDRTLVFPDEY